MDYQQMSQFTIGMNPERWRLVPVELVEVSVIKLIQDEVSVEGLINAALEGPPTNGDPFPHLISVKKNLWVEEGHDRILVWRIRGCGLMPARVLRME